MMICVICNIPLSKASNKGTKYCRSCAKKGARNGMFGKEGNRKEKCWSWSGQQPTYRALHKRIEAELGKPNICVSCERKDRKRYDWANLSGEYKITLDDWIRLCVPCHKKYDTQRLTFIKQ